MTTPAWMVAALMPAALQALAMGVDEGWFHRQRGLPMWERIGHPVDTLSAALCYAWLVVTPPGRPWALDVYAALALFSCILVTKDEFIHAKVCGGGESWLHALLFVFHPVVFLGFGFLWWSGAAIFVLRAQLALTLAFATYQVVYWSLPWNHRRQISGRP